EPGEGRKRRPQGEAVARDTPRGRASDEILRLGTVHSRTACCRGSDFSLQARSFWPRSWPSRRRRDRRLRRVAEAVCRRRPLWPTRCASKRNPPTSSSILSGGVSWLDAPFTREAQGSRDSP